MGRVSVLDQSQNLVKENQFEHVLLSRLILKLLYYEFHVNMIKEDELNFLTEWFGERIATEKIIVERANW